jgi:hypothetical protein
MKSFRAAALCIVACLIAACQTTQPPLVATTGAVNVVSVNVTQSASVPPDSDAAQRVKVYADYRLKQQSRPGGKQVQVAILITEVHRKNPAASLLIGDSNRMKASMTISGADGRLIQQREVSAMNSVVINGIIGAVAAAAADKTDTDDELADDLASQAERAVFGRALAARLKLPKPALAAAQ